MCGAGHRILNPDQFNSSGFRFFGQPEGSMKPESGNAGTF